MSATAQATLANMTTTEANMARTAIYHALKATEQRNAPLPEMCDDAPVPITDEQRRELAMYRTGHHQASVDMAMDVVSKLIGGRPIDVWSAIDKMYEHNIKADDYLYTNRPDILLRFLEIYTAEYGPINLNDA